MTVLSMKNICFGPNFLYLRLFAKDTEAPVTFSNRSIFISLCFQIDPLWIAYSNVCVFIDLFHRFHVNRG